ncbi:MobF family relaxase [Cellulomonas endophytica]|uniref:MobF family relaxase n=1 Tax=Cellulomonas endophytica TaxID=2494735 RepID=UPI001F0C743C|nr:MobF family relaxase [Cellulomonas endophytica]
MLSLHKLTSGDGYAYLTRQVAAGDARLPAGGSLGEYYAQSGNPAGRWLGQGLKCLDQGRGAPLPGVAVEAEAMKALFRDGVDPFTGLPLGGDYASQRARGRAVVCGYDLTFTAPKSVSVLWALGDSRTRQQIYDAHSAALAAALEFVERSVIRTRVGAGGTRQVTTRGMVATAFDHWDTRAGDPNLHTHVVVANKVQGHDRAWRSLDGRTMHAAVVTVSELYDALLADEVARRLPVEWERRSRGERRNEAFELRGTDDALLAHFSSRSQEIHAAETDWAAQFRESHGRSPSRTETTRARQRLTRQTRPAKVVRSLGELLEEWRNRARVLTGQEPADLAARALQGGYGRPLHAHDVGLEVREALVTQAIEDVASRRSVWSTWNLAASVTRASALLRMASPADRNRLTGEVVREAQARCVHLDDTRSPESRRVGESAYTSAELLEAERTLEHAARLGWLRGPAAKTLSGDQAYLHDLAPDQATAVVRIVESDRRLDVLVGPAGSGKTRSLAALARIHEAAGVPVLGLAPSAAAAHVLEQALGIRCETTAKWLYETVGAGEHSRSPHFHASTNSRWSLGPGQLVIVDEASLADTPTLVALLQQTSLAGGKLLLVGDELQRGAVGAGGAFGMLVRRGPTAELRSLWRFRHPWEARASLDLRHGNPEGLRDYLIHDRITGGTYDEAIDAAVDAALEAEVGGRSALLQAADSRTVGELNARTRARRVLSGDVAAEGLTLADGSIGGTGDRVITRRNDRRLVTSDGYVRNGALWDVTATHRDGSMTLRAVAGAVGVRVPRRYVRAHVELGYAITTARTQGATVEESHTVATPGMAREDLYVAMTRGRTSNHLHVAQQFGESECLGASSPETRGPVEVVAQILATTRADLSATETWAKHHPDVPVPACPQQPYPGSRPQMTGRPWTPPVPPAPDVRMAGR